VQAADDAQEAEWFPADSLPSLAFDHRDVAIACLEHIGRTELAREKGLKPAIDAALRATAPS
jgi:hypothetical protein